MNIEYTKVGDYLLPNLVIDNKNYEQINKYAYLRLDYIKKHKKGLYQSLLMKNELTNHLLSVSKECEKRYNILMNNYIKNDEKPSEKNKENNQIEWVQLMNNYKNTAEEIKNNYQKQVEPSATGLIKNFNFAEGNGDHTANLAEPEGNQAWCMGAIDTDYSWETVAQIPTNLRTENQTENSFDILWDGTDGNTWSVELSANGQVVDTKTRLTEKKASFSNLDKKDYTVRVKAHSFMETAFSDAFSVNLSTSSAITNIHKNISIVRHNNAIQIDGIQTGKLISIYTDQGILSRQISAEHETTVLSIEGFPHGIYFISIEGYGPTFKIAL